jgi:phenylacetate-CoA ligase
MRRMERVKGRSDDMLIIRGVNVFPSQIESVLMQMEQLAPHYVIEVRRPHRLDEMEVRIETRADATHVLGTEGEAALCSRAAHMIKAHIGVSAKVRVVLPNTIERSQGKAKRVLDLRSKT